LLLDADAQSFHHCSFISAASPDGDAIAARTRSRN
jgi:hypothetical protein